MRKSDHKQVIFFLTGQSLFIFTALRYKIRIRLGNDNLLLFLPSYSISDRNREKVRAYLFVCLSVCLS